MSPASRLRNRRLRRLTRKRRLEPVQVMARKRRIRRNRIRTH
jgi:hypothetical protein